jgi:copper resistance protein B
VRRPAAALIATLAIIGAATPVQAHDGPAAPSDAAPYGAPIDDQHIFSHLLIDQFEARLGDGPAAFRWSAEGWTGTDQDRLWLKTEGSVRDGQVEDGRVEALYDRPVTSFWDVQAGVRADLDSRPSRVWAGLGVEGMAPWYAKVSATAYVGEGGRLAARLTLADELRFTQRMILEPQVEADLYSRDDPGRRIGSGLSSLEAGLRLRYEITRKFAPYVGVTWEGRFGRTADFARADGERADAVRALIGLRSWF